MTPIITKKWKCISTTPPDRWTSTAEEVISPTTAAADRARRPMAGWAASSANTATADASSRLWATPLPRATAKAATPATCSHNSTTMPRWRRAQTSGVSSCPCGNAARAVRAARATAPLVALMPLGSAGAKPA